MDGFQKRKYITGNQNRREKHKTIKMMLVYRKASRANAKPRKQNKHAKGDQEYGKLLNLTKIFCSSQFLL